jgi:hypothetical protein
MEPTKTTEQILEQAAKMKSTVTEVLKRNLEGFGNLIDELRTVGHLGQAMVDMANNELRVLKLADEEDKKAKIRVYQ